MSEYTPITGELRERIGQAEHIVPLSGDSKDTQVRINLAWLTEKLDAIDSIHAQLERENESLKAELDRVLGEQEEHTHTRCESITDELRKWAGGSTISSWTAEHLTAIADRIDAEHERQLGVLYRDMSDAEWVRLPVDADGVPIRVGDYVEYVDDTLAPRNVTSINLAGDGWWVYINGLGLRPDKYRHVTPDTWERIIEDAEALAREWFNTDMSENEHAEGLDTLVARCKKLAGDAE